MGKFAPGSRAAAYGHRLIVLDEVDSTNAEAQRRVRDGECGPVWFVSDHQTAGRGRRQRVWSSPPGNLAATFLQVMNIAPASAATLGFAAALAARDACDRLATARSGESAGPRFSLKWPNDVLADGCKVAGLLLECERVSADAVAVLVGIGINITEAPANTPFPATALQTLGVAAGAGAVFTALSDAFADTLRIWDGGRGFDRIRLLWLDHAEGLGQAVAVSKGDAVCQGRFETIDADGRLVIGQENGGQALVSVGDVFFGDAASVREGVR